MDAMSKNRESAYKLHRTCRKCDVSAECAPSKSNQIWLACSVAKELIQVGKEYSKLIDHERQERKRNKPIVEEAISEKDYWWEIARKNGVTYANFMLRVRRGYTYEEASIKELKRGRRSELFTEEEKELLKQAGIAYLIAYQRRKLYKWSFEKILQKGVPKKK